MPSGNLTMPKVAITCQRGHTRNLDPTSVEDLMRSGEFTCKRCSGEYSLSDPVTLECYICGELWEVGDLEEGMHALGSNCSHCENGGFEETSFHVRASWSMSSDQFNWSQRERGTSSLKRIGRDDYWEGLIHFCTAQQFGAIQESGYIKASGTGYYRKPAVCLTEATAGGWEEMKSLHGDFGFVFRKRDLLMAGGGPALYVPQRLIDAQQSHGGFHDKLKPFVNVVRTAYTDPKKERYDHLHEREWRMPQDIVLSDIKLFGIVSGAFSSKTKGWEHIFDAKIAYPEVVLGDGDIDDLNKQETGGTSHASPDDDQF